MKKLVIIFSVLFFLTASFSFAKIIDPPNKPPTGDKVKINGKELTKQQYKALKTDRINKVRNMKTQKLTREEARDWVEIANIEIKDCPIRVNNQSIIEAINEFLVNGC